MLPLRRAVLGLIVLGVLLLSWFSGEAASPEIKDLFGQVNAITDKLSALPTEDPGACKDSVDLLDYEIDAFNEAYVHFVLDGPVSYGEPELLIWLRGILQRAERALERCST